MKVSTLEAPPSFTPVTLTVTIETKEELEALYQVGNYNDQLGVSLQHNTGIPVEVGSSVLRPFYYAILPFRKGVV